MKAKHICEYCLGVITAPSKRMTLERTVAIHVENCPAAHRGRKPMKLAPVGQLAEPPDSSSGSVGSTPTGGTRKRVIPRQVLD